MNKKIMIMGIFAMLLMLSTPLISNVQAGITADNFINKKISNIEKINTVPFKGYRIEGLTNFLFGISWILYSFALIPMYISYEDTLLEGIFCIICSILLGFSVMNIGIQMMLLNIPKDMAIAPYYEYFKQVVFGY